MARGTGIAARAAVKQSAVSAFPAAPQNSIPQARKALASSYVMAQRGQDSSDTDGDGDDEASLQLPTPELIERQMETPTSIKSPEESSECREHPEHSDSREDTEPSDSEEDAEVDGSDNDAASRASDGDAESDVAAVIDQSESSNSSDDDPDEETYYSDRYAIFPSDRNNVHQSEDDETDEPGSHSDVNEQTDIAKGEESDRKFDSDEQGGEYDGKDAARKSVVNDRPDGKELNEIQTLKAQGHWRWDDPDYDYEKDPSSLVVFAPLPREKIISKLIMSHFIPKDGIVRIKAVSRDDDSSAALGDDYPEEDAEKIANIMNIICAFRSSYKCLGGQAFRMLRFEFIKTTAIKAVLTGYRKWESTNGMPTLLGVIKTITIHKSFKQQFGDWVADMELLEAVDEEGTIKELNGLKEVVFTGMPTGRDVVKAGTCYMPSALEKLRALMPKLKKRGMQTWVVEDCGEANEEVKVRLIYGRNLHDEEFGIHEDEVLLDPSHEMKAYRKALDRNKADKQKDASRRLSAGLSSHSREKVAKAKNSKRRAASGSGSRQTKKSPKKGLGFIRYRRRSDDPEFSDSNASECDKLDRRLSDMTFDGASEEVEAPRPIFSENALAGYRERMHRAASRAEKEDMRRAMHKLLDAEMDSE